MIEMVFSQQFAGQLNMMERRDLDSFILGVDQKAVSFAFLGCGAYIERAALAPNRSR
jgi:hypothetical protein